ncbi:MAG: hypothetical protein U1E59_14540 [Amaricoccus sp.]
MSTSKVLPVFMLATFAAACVAPTPPTNAVSGSLGTYVIAPPSGCAMQPAGQGKECMFGSGGLSIGVGLGVDQQRLEPSEVSSYTQQNWEDWLLAYRTVKELGSGVQSTGVRFVVEEAVAAQVGAQKCLSLYGRLQDLDNSTITCAVSDPASGKVDVVAVGYAEGRQNPARENDGFLDRAAPVLRSLRREAAP